MQPRDALRFGSVAALALAASLAPISARADIEHTVQRGHTLEAIANRYHVSKKVIIDANHLKPGQHLRVGEVLVIPGVGNDKSGAGGKAKLGRDGKPLAQTFAMRPRTPGVVKITRVALKEDYTVRVADRRGKLPPNATKDFEKLMRSPNGGAMHEIDPRLIALVGVVSNHFGGRKLEVISGYRPYTPTQYNPHSNHMHGRAIDFRVLGVPNEVVRDFCRTLHNTGCGYYPNSVFVHMDVREHPAYWIDYSHPGEAPRYNSPNVDADEGAADVHRENPAENAPPADAPSQPVAPQMPGDPNAPAPSSPNANPSANPAATTNESNAPNSATPNSPSASPSAVSPSPVQGAGAAPPSVSPPPAANGQSAPPAAPTQGTAPLPERIPTPTSP